MNAKDRRKIRRKQERKEGANSDPLVLAELALKDYDGGSYDYELDFDESKDEVLSEKDEAETEQNKENIGTDEVKEAVFFGGAISWQELEAYNAAQHKAWAMEDLTRDYQMLIDNILESESVPAGEKADRIKALTDGFKERVLQMEQEKESTISKLIKSLFGKKDPDSNYAFVVRKQKDDNETEVLRYYPINTAENIKQSFKDVVADVRSDDPDTREIAIKAIDAVIDVAIEKNVSLDHDNKSSFYLVKDKKGGYRWFSWFTNRWRDKDAGMNMAKGGEIITDAAHKNYIQYVSENPEERMPELWLWHTRGTEFKHRADFIDYIDGFMAASGPLEKEEAKSLAKLSSLYDLRTSHGMFVKNKDDREGLIKEYYTYEISPLPAEKAANPWTPFGVFLQEVIEMGFSEDKRKFLVDALGEERVGEIESATGKMKESLEGLGVDTKEIADIDFLKPYLKGMAEEEKQEAGEEVGAEEAKQADPVADALVQLNDFLKTKFDEIDQKMKALEEPAQEKIAQAMSPKAVDPRFIWDSAPINKETEDVIKSEAAKQFSGDEFSWVDEAMNLPS